MRTRRTETAWYRPKAAGLILAIGIGAVIGVGGYTFVFAHGASYLTNDPPACAHCHVMGNHLDAWVKSSHHAVAVCNDCHTPQALLPKLWVKARNGFNHSWAFTTGRFPEPLRITAANREVTEQACRTCHEEIVHAIDPAPSREHRLDCIRCHADVGHPR